MRRIESKEDLEELVLEVGFLPFFRSPVKGFSIQELVSPRLWFSDTEDGPWEWKGPVLRNMRVAYGKFFSGKAGYIALDRFADFANIRRALRPVSSAILDPLFDISEASILEIFRVNDSLLSRELKQYLGMMPRRKRTAFDLPDLAPASPLPVTKIRGGLEKVLSNLQMGARLVIQDFEYLRSKTGSNYGWGLARYATPESLYGSDILEIPGDRTPDESLSMLLDDLRRRLPMATDRQLLRLLT